MTHRSQGFALVLVLMVSTILLVLSSVVVQNTSTESIISGNERDAIQTFIAAESTCYYVAKKLRADGNSTTRRTEDLFESSPIATLDPDDSDNTLYTVLDWGNMDSTTANIQVSARFTAKLSTKGNEDLGQLDKANKKADWESTIHCEAQSPTLGSGIEIGVNSKF